MISRAKSDVGVRRSNNEDYIFASDMAVGILPNLYIVADGMGGYDGGEIASKCAVDTFVEFAKIAQGDITDIMAEGVKNANSAVYKASKADALLDRMGTTIDCVCVDRGKAYIAHVGDSRVYKISQAGIERVTCDHSYVMDLVREGKITLEEADRHPNKNMLTRAVGSEERVQCDVILVSVESGDRLLLCSDGLFDIMTDSEIYGIVSTDSYTLEEKVDLLIDNANKLGGRDNVSVILVEC